MSSDEELSSRDFQGRIELWIRIGALIALGVGCLLILAPFAGIVAWAVIITIAADEAATKLSGWLGGRRGRAAALMVLLALIAMIGPAILLSETLVGGAQHFAASVADGSFSVPPPPEKVAGWPIIGQPIFDVWSLASENLAAALGQLTPQLEALSRWLLRAAGSAGVALLQLVAALFVAGVFLAGSAGYADRSVRLAARLIGERGPEFVGLGASTVKSVVRGILGVAAIQTVLAGLGFMVAGVPGAGVWALFVLLAAIVQLPVLLVMVPPILLVYSNASAWVAGLFVVWCVLVALLDNVLKPILFGRGVKVPALVIFLGAIGGMISMGIIGLFLGPVVLAVGYELFVSWLAEGPEETGG